MADTQYAVLGSNGTKVAVIDGALLTTDGSGGGGGGGATELTLAALSNKFPGAVLLTDDFANPTTTQIAAMPYVWDAANSNWDRRRAAVASGGAFTATAQGLAATAIYLWNNGGTAFTVLSAPRGINDNNSLDNGVAVGNYKFNNSTFDKGRNNYEATVLASASRTAAINSADQTNYEAVQVVITIDITVIPSDNITVTIKYKDTLSGKYITVLASAALAAVATTTLMIGPGLTVAANLVANMRLPRIWRAEVAVSNPATAITYSISVNYNN